MQLRVRDVVCSQAYERNVEQERSRRAGVEALEDARQKWRYSNRIQVKERRDMAERYRRTGKLDAQLSVGDIPATFSAVLWQSQQLIMSLKCRWCF